MLNPFIDLLGELIHLYILCVIVWTILATLIAFKIVNAYQPAVRKIMYTLSRLIDPVLRPIQKYMHKIFGDLGGIDLSPIVLILLLNFARSALYTYFYSYRHL